jgi:polyhydroxyalkanoate synthase subunit PhaC
MGRDRPTTAAGLPPAPPENTDPFESRASYEVLDRSLHAAIGRMSGGLSPRALALNYLDWWTHLATSPGKQAELFEKARRKALRFWFFAACDALVGGRCIEPLPQDRRFDAPEWERPPFNLLAQCFLLTQQWWHNATTGVRGVSDRREAAVEFGTRQLLDAFAPTNFLATNPEALRRTWLEGGQNLLRGWSFLLDDLERHFQNKRPAGAEHYVVGRNVAATPGVVVHRTPLMELIQYSPTTDTVRPEPVLIVPAWIMKFYVLDLSETNSLVRYLTGQGFTVFMVSWKNPGPPDRDRGMEDYRRLGPMAALDAVQAITGAERVHGVGYCLGGTLMSIVAAAMARDGDQRLASLTLFAAQTDFTEAGELMLFVSESEVTFLEDVMWEQGFLTAGQMAGAFQLLRSNDLIWSRNVRTYLLGERPSMTDLMAWNADATRMPYRMHSEYLRQFFLENRLANGKFTVDERPIAMKDIEVPIFAVGTETDHVAPWRSVHKVHLLTDVDVTFALTTGGHNAGVVSEPGHPRRRYRLRRQEPGARYLHPDEWVEAAEQRDGSWWPAWTGWLAERSGNPAAPPPLGAPDAGYPPLGPAPGHYVLER